MPKHDGHVQNWLRFYAILHKKVLLGWLQAYVNADPCRIASPWPKHSDSGERCQLGKASEKHRKVGERGPAVCPFSCFFLTHCSLCHCAFLHTFPHYQTSYMPHHVSCAQGFCPVFMGGRATEFAMMGNTSEKIVFALMQLVPKQEILSPVALLK